MKNKLAAATNSQHAMLQEWLTLKMPKMQFKKIHSVLMIQ
jgi:hypothetical protein